MSLRTPFVAHHVRSILTRIESILYSLLISLLFFPAHSFTQKKEEKKWDVSEKHASAQEVVFETDEGTWMSPDLSPDGKHIVFDLLGDLYTMPITGGDATLLLGGPAYEVQPRFSPDGKKISFTSDRAGMDDIWIMNRDGSGLQQITKDKERQTNNAIWTPDGQYIIARKHYRNTRSLGAGEMWLYHIGGGDGLQLTKRRNWEQNVGEPAISPNGRYLYYSEDISAGGGFQYNRDPYGVIYAIQRLDRETGKTETYISGAGGSVRPVVSPDGKTIAFVRRVGLHSVLYLYDVESGKETPLFDGLSKDAQEIWAIFGVYPNFAWTPDGKHIVIWAKGKIKKIEVATGKAETIPFRARITQTITDAVRFPQKVSSNDFDVKMLRWITVSPDQKSVVYNALGKLWIKSLPKGTVQRLTNDQNNFELYPSFSPDGKSVVYTTWNDTGFSAIRRVTIADGKSTTLTTRKGHYIEPSISPDGQRIVFRKVGGDNLRGELYSKDQGLYWMPAIGGAMKLITEEGSQPHFNKTGDRIFFSSREGEKHALVSVGLNGEERRVHFLSDNAVAFIPSPDEAWIAIVERYNAFIGVFPKTGQPVHIGPDTKDFPMKRVTRDAGLYLNWSADSKKLFWQHGPELFSRDLTATFKFVHGALDSIPDKPDSIGINISFKAKEDIPEGSIALVGATVITMKGDEVIPNATILIERNRITVIGASSSVALPSGVKQIDVSGKYIMPGMIDMHAHIANGSDHITPQTHWGYLANLAFGVTTSHDPSSNTEDVFANAEMIRAGVLTGPRVYSTGTILYGAEANFKVVINNYEDALSHLRRLKAVGAFSVKSYNQPRRDQKQMIIEAARELNMMVVPEGGSTLFWNLGMILDGHTGIEHTLPIAPLYNDAITLFGKSKTAYTPTLIVSYAGIMGENYWYMKSNVWDNQRLLAFTPREIIDPRSRRRMMAADDDWNYFEASKSAKRILEAGGKVALGAHGQLQGLGAHWELWMLAQGGMTSLEAIRCATLSGAQYIGLDAELGSLEKGKLADLIVLDKNPLDDVRNSESIRYVMKNGRLYDAATMNEIGTTEKKRGKLWWE